MEAKNKASHQKHAKLTRPDLGTFARREISFLGTPCGVIQSVCSRLVAQLQSELRVAYVDADHSQADHENSGQQEMKSMVYTDKIDFHRFDLSGSMNSFQYREWFNGQDLVLVNGNHFTAKRQIVFIDTRKFESLQRKLDRLTDVAGFIKITAEQEIPDFLKAHIPGWEQLPIWQPEDDRQVSAFIRNWWQQEVPPVNGLVLAGGKSQRMGRDKGLLQYHDQPQREHVYQLLKNDLGLTPFLSCRAEQAAEMPEGYDLLIDRFLGLGPFGAILSAFQQDPNRAWLVVACDLPFVDRPSLEYLLTQRDTSAVATAFHNPATGFPDPLLTLWEPRAYPVLLRFLAQGYSCPRKVLINSEVRSLEVPHDRLLTNVNNPAEFEKVKTLLADQ